VYQKLHYPIMTDAHFKGYVAHDAKAIGNLKYEQFQPKNWTEDDVEIVSFSHVSCLGRGSREYLVVGTTKLTRFGRRFTILAFVRVTCTR
jgi:hypothetical protein